MISPDDVIAIGRIGKPHGVAGEVLLDYRDGFLAPCEYLVLKVDGILVPFFIKEVRMKGGGTAYVKFNDTDTREDAAALTGSEVFFPRSEMADDADDDYQVVEGFRLIDADTGADIGTITGVDDTTANLLFEVQPLGGGDELLVPAHDDLIAEIDPEARIVRAHIPAGLIN